MNYFYLLLNIFHLITSRKVTSVLNIKKLLLILYLLLKILKSLNTRFFYLSISQKLTGNLNLLDVMGVLILFQLTLYLPNVVLPMNIFMIIMVGEDNFFVKFVILGLFMARILILTPLFVPIVDMLFLKRKVTSFLIYTSVLI